MLQDGVVLHVADDEYWVTSAEPTLHYFREVARRFEAGLQVHAGAGEDVRPAVGRGVVVGVTPVAALEDDGVAEHVEELRLAVGHDHSVRILEFR